MRRLYPKEYTKRLLSHLKYVADYLEKIKRNDHRTVDMRSASSGVRRSSTTQELSVGKHTARRIGNAYCIINKLP